MNKKLIFAIHVVVYLGMAAVLLPITCGVYWLAGGEFTRGAGLASLTLFNLYVCHGIYEAVRNSYRKMEANAALKDLYRNFR